MCIRDRANIMNMAEVQDFAQSYLVEPRDQILRPQRRECGKCALIAESPSPLNHDSHNVMQLMQEPSAMIPSSVIPFMLHLSTLKMAGNTASVMRCLDTQMPYSISSQTPVLVSMLAMVQ